MLLSNNSSVVYENTNCIKYVLITGGVISGIGKGTISSGIGALLKACGLCVTAIKIDPYINLDAGTFSPYEHGEVYVLDDGSEVDLDLGNYERFLDVTLTCDHNITTGKVYQLVIDRERRGDYLGKTVQVIPHITDVIQQWVRRVAKITVDKTGRRPDVCIIELGGVVDDIESMPFIEAFRQFQFNVGRDNFCSIHVSLVPIPKTTGEPKTKPTQMSVRNLRGAGITPDIIMCRCNSPLEDCVIEKLCMFCHVRKENVIMVPDVGCLYRFPLYLQQQSIHQLICTQFKLDPSRWNNAITNLKVWRRLAQTLESQTTEVNISLVGKYTKYADAYISIHKALTHAALHCSCKLVLNLIDSEDLEDSMHFSDPSRFHRSWSLLCNSHGVLVPGGFGDRGVEGKIKAIHWARVKGKPFLGLCLGMQLAVVEYCRNVLNIKNANSAEFLGGEHANGTKSEGEEDYAVIIDMPEHNTGKMGGTMRLGLRQTYFRSEYYDKSILYLLYGQQEMIEERHRHRFEINNEIVDQLHDAGLHFVACDESGKRMEILELPIAIHPFFIGTQYHPEYLSRPDCPSPVFTGYILAALDRLQKILIKMKSGRSRTLSFVEDEDEFMNSLDFAKAAS